MEIAAPCFFGRYLKNIIFQSQKNWILMSVFCIPDFNNIRLVQNKRKWHTFQLCNIKSVDSHIDGFVFLNFVGILPSICKRKTKKFVDNNIPIQNRLDKTDKRKLLHCGCSFVLKFSRTVSKLK